MIELLCDMLTDDGLVKEGERLNLSDEQESAMVANGIAKKVNGGSATTATPLDPPKPAEVKPEPAAAPESPTSQPAQPEATPPAPSPEPPATSTNLHLG